MNFSDLDIIARTIYGEARGEPYEGMVAVAHVIFNRVKKSGHTQTPAQVCLKPWQFSCWNPRDKNHEIVQDVKLDDISFRLAMREALEAFDGADMTNGATHYCHIKLYPDWAQGHEPVKVIGNHKFYKDIP